jgi:outer membrane protein assembly factor BamB
MRGADLWVVRDDGGLMRFDARTGIRLQAPRAPATGRVANVGGALVLVGYQEAVRFDPATGRALWHARLGRTGPAAVAQGRLWVATSDPGRPADRLVALDTRTGRVVASVAPREFSPAGLARIGSELWMTTPGGRVVVVDPGG